MRKVAICPRCEKIYKLTDTVTEAWCQHYYPLPNGKPNYDKPFGDKIECKVVDVNENKKIA